ncbi:hypothetical protein [Mesorhizobium helmanticense]|uniref:Uncharacterized protein n=1 Tax=Mesorhizobium helmanticense TaxID=1776423 RepID=A0A2T4IZ31_9HYPH|nr:hypothetical protein [Mesorhizobium helmanticense]PTE10905.1 hypothetical protein C9427_08140 [Mesorhizobium helmanticense]
MITRPFAVKHQVSRASGQIELNVLLNDKVDAKLIIESIDRGIRSIESLAALSPDPKIAGFSILDQTRNENAFRWYLRCPVADPSLLAKVINIVHGASLENDSVKEITLVAEGADLDLSEGPRPLVISFPFEVLNETEGQKLTVVLEFQDVTTEEQRAPFVEAWDNFATLAELGAFYDLEHPPGKAFAVADRFPLSNALEIVMRFERYKFDLSHLSELFGAFSTLHRSIAPVERVIVS